MCVCVIRCIDIFRSVKEEQINLLKIMQYLDKFSNFIHTHNSNTSCCEKENEEKKSGPFFPWLVTSTLKINQTYN